MKRTPRRHAVAVVAVVAAAIIMCLSGCVPFGSPHAHGQSPSSKQTHASPSKAAGSEMFASRTDALHAATHVYKRYLSVLDTITADGGEGSERIEPFVSSAFDLTLDISFESMRASGLHTSGETKIATTELADYRETADESVLVQLRTCLDVSDTRALDAAGTDVTPADRPGHTGFGVTLSTRGSANNKLLVTGTKSLRAAGSC